MHQKKRSTIVIPQLHEQFSVKSMKRQKTFLNIRYNFLFNYEGFVDERVKRVSVKSVITKRSFLFKTNWPNSAWKNTGQISPNKDFKRQFKSYSPLILCFLQFIIEAKRYQEQTLTLKGIVSVISSDLPLIKSYVRFTLVPFKPLFRTTMR